MHDVPLAFVSLGIAPEHLSKTAELPVCSSGEAALQEGEPWVPVALR